MDDKLQEYPQIAARVFPLESPIAPTTIGLGFFSRNSGVDEHPAVDGHFLTVGIEKTAVAELFLRLREMIAKNPAEYGFQRAEDFTEASK